jgi:hypothetical protein
VPPSDFPTVFSHEPAPSTSVTTTASTGRIVKAANLSPLPSNLKQGISDAISYRPGSAKIVTASPYKAELEKKRGVKSTDTGKKLNCPFSRNMVSNKMKTAKEDPFPVERVRLSQNVVKTGGSEVKPPISPSSELEVSSESEEDDGYGKEIEDEADAQCL